MISLIKKLLPQPVKHWIIAVRETIRYCGIWLFSRHRLLSSLFYFTFSRRFAREHQAVLLGRLAFMRKQGVQQDSNTLLRRNIHRIEKGLIMQPRRTLFAADYIHETVAAYVNAYDSDIHDEQEIKWATDVLAEYFKAVDLNRLDPNLKVRFEQCNGSEHSDGNSIPYAFASKPKADISPQAFHTLCVQRRSVRWFEDKPVDKTLLEQAVRMASLAPSACNRQPYRFYISNDKATSTKLVSIPGGTKGFAENVPCTIVVAADLANYPAEKDRHLVYIDSALAAMQLMLAFETLGLSSCPINFPDIENAERKMAQTLGLPMNIRPVMLIAVGYGQAEGKIPFSHKKSPAQLIEYVNLTKDA